MSHRSKIIVGSAVLGLVLFVSHPAIRYGYDVSDTVACFVTVGQHATQYATGYSDRAFSQVRTDMSSDDVLRILGEPLTRATWSSWPEGEWGYSQPASSSGHYHLRTVRFSADGKVSAAYKLFYFD
jgi:outer membrane protein assembly factor BamE (lipoprotein component of BamABCDE complex)